jgi:3-oxoacyl-[acyl-carrier-protein] synthase-1
MFIISNGMICPVGLTSAAACAAIRARIAKFDEIPLMSDRGEPIVAGAVPTLSFEMGHRERIVALLAEALWECWGAAGPSRGDRIPLLVGFPEPGRPGSDPERAPTIFEELEAKLGVRFHPRFSRLIPKGHTAGFEALKEARQLLESGAVDSCLVAGVDSYLDRHSLHWLERHNRLKSTGNSDGVIPGEAAAAVFVRRGAAETDGLSRVAGLGFGQERATVLSEEPLLGLGLTAAARLALAEAGVAMHEVDFRLSDVAGESYGFKEQALVVGRLLRVRREELPIWHCSDVIGEIGAAAGIAQIVVSSHAFRKGYAPGRRALCCTSAVGGDRACAVLERVS